MNTCESFYSLINEGARKMVMVIERADVYTQSKEYRSELANRHRIGVLLGP